MKTSPKNKNVPNRDEVLARLAALPPLKSSFLVASGVPTGTAFAGLVVVWSGALAADAELVGSPVTYAATWDAEEEELPPVAFRAGT